MTTLTDTQVITASGGLVELGYSQVTSPVSPTSTSFPGNLLGPSVTIVSDGSPSVIEFFSSAARPALGAGGAIYFVLYEDGSPKVRQWGACVAGGASDDAKPVHLQYRFTPTSGSHTYTVYAYVTGGTGYVGGGDGGAVSTQAPMFLRVSKIVQATQWPAVTTGTIICTSSTRPASPFEGQRIYETDTNKEWVYDGAAWYSPGLQGYANKTASQTVTTTADLTGLSVTWTAVASRVYRTSFVIPDGYPTIASYPTVYITDGAGSQKMYCTNLLQAGEEDHWTGFYVESGISGSVTRKIRAGTNSGSFVIALATDRPASIVVEDIGPA